MRLVRLLIFLFFFGYCFNFPNGLLAQGVDAILTNPSACGLALPLTDNNCPDGTSFFQPNRFQINITGVPGVLGVDVYLKEVRLIIAHTWADDLDIGLVSPGGITIDLTSDNGGGDDNFGDPEDLSCGTYTTFTAASCNSVVDGVAPFTASAYLPEESFFLFNDSITTANGAWILQVCDDVDVDVGSLEFVELVFESISCLPVYDVVVLDVDSTTVELDWSPSNSCGTTIVEYGPPGFTPGVDSLPNGGTIAFASCPPFFLEGLPENANVEIYVRKYCPGSGFGENACSVFAQTRCLPPAITLREAFDDDSNCVPACGYPCPINGNWENSTDDDFDWTVTSGSTSTLGTGPPEDVNGGGNYIYLETSGSACNGGKEAVLKSNCIEVDKQGSDSCHMSFNYHMYGVNVGTLKLEVSSDGGFSWSTFWERSGDQGLEWHKTYLSLSSFSDGSILQFRFIGIGGNGSKGDIALDDIIFYGSREAGAPSNTFYADFDGDGFGTDQFLVLSCASVAPMGFVDNSSDCDDTNPEINPGEEEVPCDGIDNNCNDAVINDDPILPPPLVGEDTIEVCSGEPVILCATPAHGGFIFWYASPDGNDAVGVTNNCFLANIPPNNTPTPEIHRFYAAESTFQFNCESEIRSEVVVIVHPNPNVSSVGSASICPGESFDLSGIVINDANFTGGTVTFHADSPANPANELPSSIVRPVQNETYYYLVTSDQGCTDENSITIQIQPGPSLTFSPAQSFSLCKEGVDTVTVQASGGAGGYSYFWSTGAESNQVELEASFQTGTEHYLVTVTDAAGCFTVDSVTLMTTANIDSLVRFVTDVSSCNGNDGSISLTPLNGTPPFAYQWLGPDGMSDSSGINGTFVLDNLSQGSYNITITDSSPDPCDFILRSVLVNGPGAIINEVDVKNLSCAGAFDGEICLEVMGDNPSFLWSTNDTTSCINNLAGGIYSVTIFDGPCENILNDIVVLEPDELKLRADVTEPSCADAIDGAITVTPFGGTPTYSYEWSIPGLSNSLKNLIEGTYFLTLTDNKNCVLQDSFELIAPDPLTVQIDSILDISCAGAADGFIKVNATGGTLPYNYSWNTGSTAPILSNLDGGTYTVTVSDFYNCSVVQSINIQEPDLLSLSLVEAIDPQCIGDENGQIEVQANGGTPPYEFAWSNGGIGRIQAGLGVDSFFVFVKDIRGCISDTLFVNLTATSFLDLDIVIQDPTCIGLSNGTINLQPNGITPFSYNWERGDQTASINNVGVGMYAVTIEDGQNCLYDTTLSVTAPQAIEVNVNGQPPFCAGEVNGSIDVNIINPGTPPLDFEWNTGQLTRNLNNLNDGAYVLTITDDIGCQLVTDTIVLTSPEAVDLQLDGLGQISCAGDSTGFIEFTVVGGVAPYTYLWGGGIQSMEEDQFNLPAGQFTILVLDSNMCAVDTTIILNEPDPLITSVSVESIDECTGVGINKISAFVQGGVRPYSYRWSNGDSLAIIENIPSGDYSLTVEDANGCMEVISSIKVRETAAVLQIDTFFTKDISCFNLDDGSATVAVKGGRAPYLYHFSNGVKMQTSGKSLTIQNLKAGNYDVTVLDMSSGCFVHSDEKLVQEPPALSYGRDSTNTINCFGGNDGAIFATARGGIRPYAFQWFDEEGDLVGENEDIDGLFSGVYSGVVMDINGCTDTIFNTAISSSNSLITLVDSLTNIRDVNCKGANTGAIDVTITGGDPPYLYQWSNNTIGQDLFGIPAGTYELTVTDEDTCRVIIPGFVVEEPDMGIEVEETVEHLLCFGEPEGLISLSVMGGVPPYLYSWEYEGTIMEEEESFVDSIFAGTYFVAIQDDNNCTLIKSFEIDQPDKLEVNIDVNPPSPPDQTASATAVPMGGVPPYRYRWSTGDTTKIIRNLVTGGYSLTTTDQNNCSVITTTTIVSTLDPSLVEHIQFYPNPTSGQAILSYQFTESLTFQWRLFDVLGNLIEEGESAHLQDGNLPLDFTGLSSGSYWLMLTSDRKPLAIQKVMIIRE